MRKPSEIIKDVKKLIQEKELLYQEFLEVAKEEVSEEKIKKLINIEERLDDMTTKLLKLKDETDKVALYYNNNDLIQ